VILRPKSPNRSCRFWCLNREIRATGFETEPGENAPVVLRPNHWQTVLVVLRLNHWQTIDLGFEPQPKNPRSLSPRARCRPHTVSPDLPIIRPLITRPLRPSPFLYTMSSTPSMTLVAAHHTAPATCTSWDKQTRFSTWYKDKGKTTKISWIWIQTSPSQWLITLKPRNWPLSLSISPWWVHRQQKAQVWSSNSRSHEAQLEDQNSQ
jgi:hypothetical protein